MTATTGIGVHDQNLERQIEKHMGGCMAGFFNIFDRSHVLSGGKRLYPKRLPPSSQGGDSASEPGSSLASPAVSREFERPRPQQPQPHPQQSLKPKHQDQTTDPPKSPLVPTTPERKSASQSPSPWKFSREAPRLSLDSRAVVDAKGTLRPREIKIINTPPPQSGSEEERESSRQGRSPSVIARLMGLEPLPNSSSSTSTDQLDENQKPTQLRRSASESRSRDYYKFFDTPSFLSPPLKPESGVSGLGGRKVSESGNSNTNPNPKQRGNGNKKGGGVVERRSYYNANDFFPQEGKNNEMVSVCGEIERRLRMRGMDETTSSTNDLETLKHILEALQLKGLLHCPPGVGRREREEERVVVMKPAGVRRKGGPLSVETRRRDSERTSVTPVRGRGVGRGPHSPSESPRRTRVGAGSSTRKGDQTINKGSPRARRSTVEIERGRERERDRYSPHQHHYRCGGGEDEVSTISESSFSTSSYNTDHERWRGEEYRDGRSLLERCDKLLHSIAEMNTNTNSTSSSAELQQPSPVSVLDSSFYKEDDSPSPVKKRTIDFKDQVVMELEDELLWSPSSSTQLLLKPDYHFHDIDSSDDSDFTYVSEVFRASNYFPEEADLFLLIEKQSTFRGNKDYSNESILQRKLIFDTITEILDRNRQLPPWRAGSGTPTLREIWLEFRKIRERGSSDDLFEVICGVLKKDLAEDPINGWGDCHVEASEAVLDIERLIFKDLIGEAIVDLAAVAGKSVGAQAPRRKLVF